MIMVGIVMIVMVIIMLLIPESHDIELQGDIEIQNFSEASGTTNGFLEPVCLLLGDSMFRNVR